MNERKQLSPRELADALVREGIGRTTTGRWSVSFEEIKERFGLDLSANTDGGRLLAKELQQEEEVNELIMTEDNIEMAYHLEDCPACGQGGASGMGSVFSLLGCNIYDDHLHLDDKGVPENESEPDAANEQTDGEASDLVMR